MTSLIAKGLILKNIEKWGDTDERQLRLEWDKHEGYVVRVSVEYPKGTWRDEDVYSYATLSPALRKFSKIILEDRD